MKKNELFYAGEVNVRGENELSMPVMLLLNCNEREQVYILDPGIVELNV